MTRQDVIPKLSAACPLPYCHCCFCPCAHCLSCKERPIKSLQNVDGDRKQQQRAGQSYVFSSVGFHSNNASSVLVSLSCWVAELHLLSCYIAYSTGKRADVNDNRTIAV